MKLTNEHHSFTGMQRDMAHSKQPSSFLYDAHNIRLTARGEDTLLTITNERGPEEMGISITGTYLGHCLLGNYLVVFSTTSKSDDTTEKKGARYIKILGTSKNTSMEVAETSDEGPDYISLIDLAKGELSVLYNGHLNFSTECPIEAIASFENASIQKVYWVDGRNQPRIINIKGTILEGVDSQFDFVRELALKEKVIIEKQLGAAGSFSPGVIQYAFTYYTKYGQESNIFYTSPLLYVSHKDRGGSPEDKVENVFNITVNNLDFNFDYLRIYSIQRTSLNGTPIVKRVQDIYIRELEDSDKKEVSFIDTGLVGDSIDPTELLFKGGESVIASTIEQKDNTLFLGSLKMERPFLTEEIKDSVKDGLTLAQSTRTLNLNSSSNSVGYDYANQLTIKDKNTTGSTSCGGFKFGDYYRCGVQFQYKNGKWSDPIWHSDIQINKKPNITEEELTLPTIKGTLDEETVTSLRNLGYKKVRAVVVFPEVQDRVVICQGVTCPTLYTNTHRSIDKDLYAQSSWFFRPAYGESVTQIDQGYLTASGSASPSSDGTLKYQGIILPDIQEDNSIKLKWDPSFIRQIEIQGGFNGDNQFKVDNECVTLHSPDIEFGDLADKNFIKASYRQVGYVDFTKTFSDINIQTETPTIDNRAGGLQHKSFIHEGTDGIISGLFYDDFIVDDSNGELVPYERERAAVKWVVYPWNKSGSLNNDINRPSSKGAQSALLKKKVISNLRYAESIFSDPSKDTTLENEPQIFNNNELAIVKLKDGYYQGNIDTILLPDYNVGMLFACDAGYRTDKDGKFEYFVNKNTKFNSTSWWQTFNTAALEEVISGDYNKKGLWVYNTSTEEWQIKTDDIGDKYDLLNRKEGVRIKYKSSPHMIIQGFKASKSPDYNESILPIVEIIRRGDKEDSYYRNTMFGGSLKDALKANTWIPCGEPVYLESNDENANTAFEYSYGDTYYQRWDCLKTYPFTTEDVNQIVEIGSFMLETRTNIDGRYDRNRGQLNNLNMTPRNFNLINPVYSQINNFFTYRILDDDYYKINYFPNQITWTKEKQLGADVDLWTNVTLASVHDMDGSKGSVTSVNMWKDTLYCFQDTGISTILFNSRVQIPASDGIPIEISNSYKVDGHRYISDGIGCVNKWTISNTPSGLYFIDSKNNHLCHIGEGLQDITTMHNMTSWFNNIKDNEIAYTLHDNINNDLYLFTNKEALCYSEILSQFTSFMSYDKVMLLESNNGNIFSMREGKLYRMFEGDYNTFFEDLKGWDLTFISNGVDNNEMDFDKIFSTIDYRMDMFSVNAYASDESLSYIKATNEYQDTGEVPLSRLKTEHPLSYNHKDANLQKKFRIWRIQIPRNKNSLDRIRNPWCKIKLGNNGNNNLKAVLHDLNVQYFV